MTASQLIAALQRQDPNAEVVLLYQLGDYCRRTVGDEVHAVEKHELTWSEPYGVWVKGEPDEDGREITTTFVTLEGC